VGDSLPPEGPPAGPVPDPVRDRLWTTKQLIGYLGATPHLIRTLYEAGGGPPSYRVGRFVRWDPIEVRAWLRAQRINR
jgi:predicted DNA-binding transcriptional regulator AlpA